jgi:hypothetical protein
MTETTYEEAKRCPKCQTPGEDRRQTSAGEALPQGTKIHHIYCVNERCEWYNTPWMIQVNVDGSVPPPQDHRGKPKVYEGFEGHDQMARDIRAMIDSERRNSMRDGGHFEIRKR